MKIVGILCSPRPEGNTAHLIQQVLDGAAEAGADTTLLRLDDLDIHPCKACMVCRETCRCVQRDDMDRVMAELDRAAGLVVGAPIYLDHVAAQAKVFLDRLYPYIGPNLEKRFPPGVKAVVVLTWEHPKAHAYDNVAEWLRGRLEFYFGIETIATLTAADTGNHPAAERAGVTAAARQAGRELAVTE